MFIIYQVKFNITFDELLFNLSLTDFGEERDAIISRIVPGLREEIKQKYGFEFHVSR